MNETVENAFTSLSSTFDRHLRESWARYSKVLPRRLESPIEEAMLIGLIGVAYLVPIFKFESDNIDTPSSPDLVAFVQPQVSIAGYRVDFLLDVTDKGAQIARIAIECDGHDFHDRTREQAARDKSRDRALTTAGLRVMRFTGSEIYRDVQACALDVVDAIISLSGRRSIRT